MFLWKDDILTGMQLEQANQGARGREESQWRIIGRRWKDGEGACIYLWSHESTWSNYNWKWGGLLSLSMALWLTVVIFDEGYEMVKLIRTQDPVLTAMERAAYFRPRWRDPQLLGLFRDMPGQCLNI